MLIQKLENISTNIDYTKQNNIYFLMHLMNEYRMLHTLSVVKSIEKICFLNNLDERTTTNAVLAGYYHDFAKGYLTNLELEEYNNVFKVIKNLDEPIELYHGHIASDIMQRFLNINNEIVFNAINNHTLLQYEIDIVSKILFVADYTEELRKFVSVDVLNNYTNINKAFDLTIIEKFTFLKNKKAYISKGLKEKYEEIKMEKISDLKVVINALEEKLAKDIVVIDMHGVSPILDYNVVCHGTSARQLESIAKELKDQANIHGIEISHVEGLNSQKWILVDLKDIVIHIFDETERYVYHIEKLLGDLPQIPLEQIK